MISIHRCPPQRLGLILLEWDAEAARLGPPDEDDPRPSCEPYDEWIDDIGRDEVDAATRADERYDEDHSSDADTYGEDWPF